MRNCDPSTLRWSNSKSTSTGLSGFSVIVVLLTSCLFTKLSFVGRNFSVDANSSLFFFSQAGSVLIFVTKKANSEELAGKLKTKDFEGTFSVLVISFVQQCLGVASKGNLL